MNSHAKNPGGELDGNRTHEGHYALSHPIVLAGSAFALGLATGLLLKGAGKQVYERVRAGQVHREVEQTVTFDENLPEQLGRREPSPQPGQPRYGGTGALGVPATSAVTGRTEE
jgi:hypothetical protein